MSNNSHEEETAQDKQVDETEETPEVLPTNTGYMFEDLPESERVTLDEPEPGDEMGMYEEPDEAAQFVVLYIVCAVVIVLSVGLAFVIYAWIMQLVPSWTLIVLIAAAAALPIWWAHGTIKEAKRRRPTPMRLALPVDFTHMWVSPETLRKLLNVLITDPNHLKGSDGAIQLVTRKTQWSWVRHSWLQILGIGVAAFFAFNGLPPYVWLLITVALLLWIGRHYVNWVSWYIIVTDKRIYVVKQPPVWLWWRENEPFPLLLADLQVCHPDKQSGVGNYFNYGVLVVDLMGDRDDEVFNKIEFIPRAKEVSDLINLLKLA